MRKAWFWHDEMSITGSVVANVLTVLLCGAVASASAVSAPAQRGVVDDTGHRITVRSAPLRIVSLAPGATEMLFAAGGGAELIATVEYSDEPPAARRVPRIGDASSIDMERLVSLHPDVVLAWPGGGNPAQRQKIDALHLPVYEQELTHLADIPAALQRLGELAGTQPQAQQAARAIGARLAALAHTYEPGGRARPSVLLQVWNRPIYTVGGRQLMSDALTLCGARNVFADLAEPGPVVDTEAVIARNPDIIVAAAPPGEAAAWVADWQRFGALAAVRNARVVAFEDQGLSRLGPSVIDATDTLCRMLAQVSHGNY
jgi:iron complex transport system substrate-binding protein